MFVRTNKKKIDICALVVSYLNTTNKANKSKIFQKLCIEFSIPELFQAHQWLRDLRRIERNKKSTEAKKRFAIEKQLHNIHNRIHRYNTTGDIQEYTLVDTCSPQGIMLAGIIDTDLYGTIALRYNLKGVFPTKVRMLSNCYLDGTPVETSIETSILEFFRHYVHNDENTLETSSLVHDKDTDTYTLKTFNKTIVFEFIK